MTIIQIDEQVKSVGDYTLEVINIPANTTKQELKDFFNQFRKPSVQGIISNIINNGIVSEIYLAYNI